MHVSKSHIYFFVLFAFFLYALSSISVVSPDSIIGLGTSAFSFVTIALILALYKLWTVKYDPKRRLKMMILVSFLLALFCYTYVMWYDSRQGGLFKYIFASVGMHTKDNTNMITASFSFITIAFLLFLYKCLLKLRSK